MRVLGGVISYMITAICDFVSFSNQIFFECLINLFLYMKII